MGFIAISRVVRGRAVGGGCAVASPFSTWAAVIGGPDTKKVGNSNAYLIQRIKYGSIISLIELNLSKCTLANYYNITTKKWDTISKCSTFYLHILHVHGNKHAHEK